MLNKMLTMLGVGAFSLCVVACEQAETEVDESADATAEVAEEAQDAGETMMDQAQDTADEATDALQDAANEASDALQNSSY